MESSSKATGIRSFGIRSFLIPSAVRSPEGEEDNDMSDATPHKILIIDDSKLAIMMLYDGLRQNGFEVLIASDGDEGLQMAVLESPDLIILDMHLPSMNGREFLVKLKEFALNPLIPVIVLTASEPIQDIALDSLSCAPATRNPCPSRNWSPRSTNACKRKTVDFLRVRHFVWAYLRNCTRPSGCSAFAGAFYRRWLCRRHFARITPACREGPAGGYHDDARGRRRRETFFLLPAARGPPRGRAFGRREPAGRLISYLKFHQIRKIDAVVITHPHQNHFGGLRKVAGGIPIGRVFHNGDPNAEKGYSALLSYLERKRVPVEILMRGQQLEQLPDSVTVEVLNPPDLNGTANDNSLALRLKHGNVSFLLLGDIGPDRQDALCWRRSRTSGRRTVSGAAPRRAVKRRIH